MFNWTNQTYFLSFLFGQMKQWRRKIILSIVIVMEESVQIQSIDWLVLSCTVDKHLVDITIRISGVNYEPLDNLWDRLHDHS